MNEKEFDEFERNVKSARDLIRGALRKATCAHEMIADIPSCLDGVIASHTLLTEAVDVLCEAMTRSADILTSIEDAEVSK